MRFSTLTAILTAGTLAAFTLSACTPEIDSRVDQIQVAALKGCSYLPKVQAAAAILVAGDPTVAAASAIGSAICLAVTSLPTKTLVGGEAPCPEVNGVCVTGEFVELGGK